MPKPVIIFTNAQVGICHLEPLIKHMLRVGVGGDEMLAEHLRAVIRDVEDSRHQAKAEALASREGTL